MNTTQTETLAELIERLRSLSIDHGPKGWPAVRTRDVTALLDRIAELEAIGAGGVSGPLMGRAALSANAGEPTEDVKQKIASNTWDNFGDILPTLKAISRGEWYWGANSRCKYIEIRLDTRDGGCLLYDRERVRISPEQFAHQHHRVRTEPWPASNSLAAPQPALSAGWVSLPGALPKPGTPVLLDIGEKYPIRAQWVPKDSLEATGDGDYGEYNEASDMYYWPEGWYEWNQYEETHWRVDETPRAWQPLPASPTIEGEKP